MDVIKSFKQLEVTNLVHQLTTKELLIKELELKIK